MQVYKLEKNKNKGLDLQKQNVHLSNLQKQGVSDLHILLQMLEVRYNLKTHQLTNLSCFIFTNSEMEN